MLSSSATTDPATSPGRVRPRAPLLWAAALALLALMLGLLLDGSAAAQSKSERLQQVRDRQASLSDRIQSHNGEVNALIGQVSQMREREEQANAELAAREAELESTTAELEQGRERLEELREEFARASRELEGMLLSLYKSGSPDLGALMLDSSNFEDFALLNEYFNRLQSYQSAVITRAAELRDETEGLVAELAADRERIAAARDEIAARRDEIAASRAGLEARERELAAARSARRQTLASLERRENRLVDALSTPAPEPEAPEPEAPEPERPSRMRPIPRAARRLPPRSRARRRSWAPTARQSRPPARRPRSRRRSLRRTRSPTLPTCGVAATDPSSPPATTALERSAMRCTVAGCSRPRSTRPASCSGAMAAPVSGSRSTPTPATPMW